VRILASGFAVLDIIAADIDRLPKPGKTIFAPLGIKFWIGGHPVNLTVDLMQLGCRMGDVGIAAAIGEDLAGEFIRRKLEESGVTTFLQVVKSEDTGKSVVLVLQGRDRSFIASPGANLHLSPDHVINSLMVFSPNVFYVACGILGEFDILLGRILSFCHQQEILTFLDIVRPYGKDWDFIYNALKYINILHVNTNELRGITRSSDVKKGLKKLHDLGVQLPIVTDGEAGVITLHLGKYIKQPAFKVDVVDPTGAGDAFCAGLLKKLYEKEIRREELCSLNHEELFEMLLFAQAAGAACVESVGTTTGVSLKRVEDLLKSQGEHVLSSTTIRS
jgi:sugar/nucleoside kinase (ribokinase family)